MTILETIYHKITGKKAPYYLRYSVITLIKKPIRKWIVNVIAPNCVFNCIRIFLYRLCGFKIGKHVFIGMHCYLDDMCYKMLTIGDNVTVSYGVYFACHGKNQAHMPITIKDNAYIGMHANIISRNADKTTFGVTVGEGAIVGSCTLVNRNVPTGMTAVGVPCRIIADNRHCDNMEDE